MAKKSTKNMFNNDIEKIEELKACLEHIHDYAQNHRDPDVTTINTLVKTTLYWFNEGKKFNTATDITMIGNLEYVNN